MQQEALLEWTPWNTVSARLCQVPANTCWNMHHFDFCWYVLKHAPLKLLLIRVETCTTSTFVDTCWNMHHFDLSWYLLKHVLLRLLMIRVETCTTSTSLDTCWSMYQFDFCWYVLKRVPVRLLLILVETCTSSTFVDTRWNMYQFDLSCCCEEHWNWVAALVYSTLSQKLETSIIYLNRKCESDIKMNGKHLSKELEIFEAAGEMTRNINLLPNSIFRLL